MSSSDLSSSTSAFSGISYSFDGGIAKIAGVHAAIVFRHIQYWIGINMKRKRNVREGKTWMYETSKEMQEHIDFLSEDQIDRAIKSLVDCGLVVLGNFNKSSFDRTRWFSLCEKSLTKPQICGMETVSARNPNLASAGPIPDEHPLSIERTTTTESAVVVSSVEEIQDQLRRMPSLKEEDVVALAETMAKEQLSLSAVAAAISLAVKKKPDNPAGFVLAAARKGWTTPVSNEPEVKIADPTKVRAALCEIYEQTGHWIGCDHVDHLEIFRKGIYPYGEDRDSFLRSVSTAITSSNLLIFMKHLS